jgi:hypothetical protein
MAYIPQVEGWGPTLNDEEIQVLVAYLLKADKVVKEQIEERSIVLIDLTETLQPDGPGSKPPEEYFLPLGLTEAGNTSIANLLRQTGYNYSPKKVP